MSSTKLWVMTNDGYDESTIVGIYDSEELAEAERTRCEAVVREHGDEPRRRSRQLASLQIREYTLNETGQTVIVRLRKDGVIAEKHVSYTFGNSGYERLIEGRAPTFEKAMELAHQDLTKSRSTSREETENG